jgi:hypothetical protein
MSITNVVVLSTRNLGKLSCNFPNFLRFCREFTRFSNILLLLEIRFCAEAPGKKWGLAIGSLGVRAARPARIPANRRRCRPGNRWERSRGPPSVDSRPELGSGLP